MNKLILINLCLWVCLSSPSCLLYITKLADLYSENITQCTNAHKFSLLIDNSICPSLWEER